MPVQGLFHVNGKIIYSLSSWTS